MENNKLLKNALYNMMYRGFTALFPLITTGYISRVLLAEGVGKVSYANTIVMYFTTVASLGIPTYGVKAIAQCGNKDEKSKTFIELFLINFISTLLCVCSYYLFVNLNGHFSGKKELFDVMGLLLVLNIFNMDWLYQGVEEYGYIATRSIIIKIISFILMLLLVKKPSDYLMYAFILCLATAGNYIFNAIHLNRYITVRKYKFSIKKHLKPVFILLAAAIATEIYTILDTVMLEYFHGDVYVGYYSSVVKIVRMIYTIVIALVAAFYPRISCYIKEKNMEACENLLQEGTNIILVFAVPCVVGTWMTSDLIVPILFGNDFLPAIKTLKILSVLIFVFSIAYFLGHVVLMAMEKEKIILYATICGALVNAVTNMILIPIQYQDGAAIASVIAECVVTLVMLSYSFKIISLNFKKRFWCSTVCATFFLILDVNTVKRIVQSNELTMIICILSGAVVYFGILLLMKNEVAEKVRRKLKDFFKNRTKG